ncbi:hypothetical protein [uncultured Devosia sp.]|uniref:hypothetical protein n=1 Tax=uncultured Devosia sp. TaxID=211434 RepID=UPI0035C990CF
MRRIALTATAVVLLATPAAAQSYTGNWGCRDDTANRAGILTIYGDVYGFASATFGDTASGTGTLTPYEDGVGFTDGPLKAVRGIEAGRIIPDPDAGVALQLETADAIVMLCLAH